MTREIEKSQREIRVFRDFLFRSGLRVDLNSVEKRLPPEPDILCRYLVDGLTAFELVELCDPNIAAAQNRRNSPDVYAFWTSDPSTDTLRGKVSKVYRTPHPIELLCYTANRIITPDDVVIPTLLPIVASNPGPFRRVWFSGDSTVRLLYAVDGWDRY